MILIYTGNGKGKTCACVGQACRALGQGLRVAFAQFMKRDGEAGEQRLLSTLLGEGFYAGGMGFFRSEAERAAHREAALTTLAWAKKRVPRMDMVILDESLYALGSELLTAEELTSVLTLCRQQSVHLVLSGRNAPLWLKEEVDLVTDMQEIRHPWRQGVTAQKGIEY